jgi:diaminohydroxyphosphoribosylaminopyrimidine deaminase/5-amino-6-(5-phosphoribosylamino)uracil reductase
VSATDSTFSDFDRRMMARALELAERGADTAHPNPRVGCVLTRGDRIIAEGWHQRQGGPHGEAAALLALPAGTDAVGATAYVNLEPCNHFGRTPPCSQALIAARVARVVYSIDDPNPQVAGKGAAALRAAGIKVESGLMVADAEEINIGFLKRMRSGRPFVRVKMGASLDGRVALANGKSKWITGEAARADVQKWRARSSAILTGIGTVLADDPQLNVRLPDVQRQPTRVILDSKLRTPPAAKILDSSAPTVIFAQSGSVAVEAALAAKGARIERSKNDTAPVIDLAAVLSRLAELQVNEVLVEAGPTLSGAFVQYGMADELLLYIAPKLLGPQARPLFELPLLQDLQRATHFRIIDQQLVGEDLRLRLRPS